MKDKTLYALHANICKALANPIRIEVIDILSKNELTFGDILKETAVMKSNLSQHLSLMVASGILVQRKEGSNVYFKLTTDRIATACQIMREVLIDNIKKQSQLVKKFK
jgi:ArsR family transcriptional regulator